MLIAPCGWKTYLTQRSQAKDKTNTNTNDQVEIKIGCGDGDGDPLQTLLLFIINNVYNKLINQSINYLFYLNENCFPSIEWTYSMLVAFAFGYIPRRQAMHWLMMRRWEEKSVEIAKENEGKNWKQYKAIKK